MFQNTVTHTCTWVLDTLKENGPRFCDLFNENLGAVTGEPGPMGGDFTVTARIKSTTVASPATACSRTGAARRPPMSKTCGTCKIWITIFPR